MKKNFWWNSLLTFKKRVLAAPPKKRSRPLSKSLLCWKSPNQNWNKLEIFISNIWKRLQNQPLQRKSFQQSATWTASACRPTSPSFRKIRYSMNSIECSSQIRGLMPGTLTMITQRNQKIGPEGPGILQATTKPRILKSLHPMR